MISMVMLLIRANVSVGDGFVSNQIRQVSNVMSIIIGIKMLVILFTSA